MIWEEISLEEFQDCHLSGHLVYWNETLLARRINMLPWCLNLNFSLMSPSKPSFSLIGYMVLEMSFEQFQYGHHGGHFAYQNGNNFANLYLHVGLMPRMITAQYNLCFWGRC